jgi:hypothetical protein
MTLMIYGIKNCDTVKKARAWLDQKVVAYAAGPPEFGPMVSARARLPGKFTTVSRVPTT